MLSAWVMRQRVNKKKLDRGEPSCHSARITAERAVRLEALGFVWDQHEAAGGAGGAAGAADSLQGGARRLQRAEGLG